MNDPVKAFTDAWTSGQQAFFRGLFPMVAPSAEATAEPVRPPLEEHFAELQDTWKASIEKWVALAGDKGSSVAPGPEALRELFEASGWAGPGAGAFDAGLRQVIEGPQFATLSDLDRKLAELQLLAARRAETVAAYQAIIHGAWTKVTERFQATFVRDDAMPRTWRELADRWIAVANETLMEVHRSDAFIEAQRRMLRVASDYRLQERKIAEAWCEASHIPTRTEMDEMQRVVTELRRQVRSLRRDAGKPGAAATPATMPTAGVPPPKAKRAPSKTSRSASA